MKNLGEEEYSDKRKSKVAAKFIEILQLVPDKTRIDIPDGKTVSIVLHNRKPLFAVSKSQITVPGLSLPQSLFAKPSPLPDSFVPTSQIKELFDYLTSNNLFQRLNHMGFCYQVSSIDEEKKRLQSEVEKSSWHLYKEESSDESTWFFVGDKTNWQDPLVEYVLVEKTTDKWKNYWLPHIQIDVDTYLSGEEIEELVKKVFQGKVQPFRLLVVDGYIVLVRARLGIISGVNINVDFGTEGRMTRFHRTKLLSQIA